MAWDNTSITLVISVALWAPSLPYLLGDRETPGYVLCIVPRLIYTILEYRIIVVVSLPYSKIINIFSHIYHH